VPVYQTDPYFNYTTILLSGDTFNTLAFNSDASVNNYNVSITGNVSASRLTPYGNNWSNYFDGTGDYLTVPASAVFAPGTGDFTVEGWIYPTNLMSAASGVIWSQTVSGTNYFAIFANNGVIQFYGTLSGGGSAITSGSNNWALNTWNHFAVVNWRICKSIS